MEIKICRICKNHLPIRLYYYPNPNMKDGYRNECKDCTKELRKKHYLQSTPSEANRKSRYGITKEDYEKKVEEQDNLCAICRQPETKKPSLLVDHCHITNKLRGLLCIKCNSGIGMFQDNIELLKAAIVYLEKHSEAAPEKPNGS